MSPHRGFFTFNVNRNEGLHPTNCNWAYVAMYFKEGYVNSYDGPRTSTGAYILQRGLRTSKGLFRTIDRAYCGRLRGPKVTGQQCAMDVCI